MSEEDGAPRGQFNELNRAKAQQKTPTRRRMPVSDITWNVTIRINNVFAHLIGLHDDCRVSWGQRHFSHIKTHCHPCLTALDDQLDFKTEKVIFSEGRKRDAVPLFDGGGRAWG
jgi:hypothetical protein